MNRNPIPRGRAAESVDWLTELFKFLPPTPSSIGVSSVRVPLTLVFKHSKAHTWYMSGKRAGVMESVPSGDTEEIISRYVNQATVNAASLGLEDQIDVIALYAWTQKSSDKSSGQRSRTRIEYFDEGLQREGGLALLGDLNVRDDEVSEWQRRFHLRHPRGHPGHLPGGRRDPGRADQRPFRTPEQALPDP